MTDHTHTTLVPGCYRCDLNRDEAADAWATERAELLADMRNYRDYLAESLKMFKGDPQEAGLDLALGAFEIWLEEYL